MTLLGEGGAVRCPHPGLALGCSLPGEPCKCKAHVHPIVSLERSLYSAWQGGRLRSPAQACGDQFHRLSQFSCLSSFSATATNNKCPNMLNGYVMPGQFCTTDASCPGNKRCCKMKNGQQCQLPMGGRAGHCGGSIDAPLQGLLLSLGWRGGGLTSAGLPTCSARGSSPESGSWVPTVAPALRFPLPPGSSARLAPCPDTVLGSSQQSRGQRLLAGHSGPRNKHEGWC